MFDTDEQTVYNLIKINDGINISAPCIYHPSTIAISIIIMG